MRQKDAELTHLLFLVVLRSRADYTVNARSKIIVLEPASDIKDTLNARRFLSGSFSGEIGIGNIISFQIGTVDHRSAKYEVQTQ